MIPRPNLGSDSIFTLHQIHPRSRRTSYEETTSAASAIGGAYVHSY